MKPSVVVDTNVPVVANGRSEQASPECVLACLDFLEASIVNGLVVIDDAGKIFDEYFRYLSLRGQPGAGDRFVKWLWTNQANLGCCRRVAITRRDGDGEDYEEFPLDLALERFDPSDRKFVAVARASGLDPVIANAADGGWWTHRAALQAAGVRLLFLCPELMPDQ